MIHPMTGTWKTSALPRKRGSRPLSYTKCPKATGSKCETWLAARTTPPVCGIISAPRQSLFVSSMRGGRSSTPTSPNQKPILRRLTTVSSSRAGPSTSARRSLRRRRPLRLPKVAVTVWPIRRVVSEAGSKTPCHGEGVGFGDARVCVSRSVVMSMSDRGADGGRTRTPPPATEARQPTWSIVVPVKRLSAAKTRLSLSEHPRNVLALAFACDTVTAALACPLVTILVAVTSDLPAARELERIGALVVPDGPEAGLNAALEYGAKIARQRAPDRGTAALSADLPALRPEALGRALLSA